MKLQYILSFLFIINFSFAQNNNEYYEENNNESLNQNPIDSVDTKNNYNKWSVEFNFGASKGIRPFTENYYSSNPKEYLNLSNTNHYDLGFRYMFNEYFGVKFELSQDLFKNEEGSGSLPFEAKMLGFGLKGVFNVGKIMHFNAFTKKVGLLAHTGIKISQFTPSIGGYKGVTEDNGGITFGITPQYKFSDRFVLSADFTALSNMRQHFNWDGISVAKKEYNLTGLMHTFSLGFTYYIGKLAVVHADWYDEEKIKEENNKIDIEARNRLDELEAMLSDVDRDGIADYLDFENNTPGGVAVDSRGRFIDINNNGVPDELESRRGGQINKPESNNNSSGRVNNNRVPQNSNNSGRNNNIPSNNYNNNNSGRNNSNIPGNNNGNQSNNNTTKNGFNSSQSIDSNVMKSLAENGFLNIYFDVNKAVPDTSSTNALYTLYTYLSSNPSIIISLRGYADVTGGATLNYNLSEKRAKFVHDYLVNNGISSNRIYFVGDGVDDSVLSGNKEIDYRMSRRVSVYFLD